MTSFRRKRPMGREVKRVGVKMSLRKTVAEEISIFL